MKEIVKTFSGVKALNRVNFSVQSGEIHALLGANGAGKSTLMKILSGAYDKDGGTIEIDGHPLEIKSPADAKNHGIHCVYQEVDTALVPGLSVAENILLDRVVSGNVKRWLSRGYLHREAEAIVNRAGLPLAVGKNVDELSLSEKQLTLIARAMAQRAQFIIFDEPTAPLSIEEAEQLFQIMGRLKSEGVGCIFISHRLPEVFRISDRISVLRDGQNVMTKRTEETSVSEVIRSMLGKPFEEEYPKTVVPLGETLLEARGIKRGWKVRGIDLTVRRGEIVGIAGLVGAGKTELARLLYGADPMEAGEMYLRGQRLHLRSPKDAVQAGIVLVPEERRKEGIFIDEGITANLTLPTLSRFSRLGFLRTSMEQSHAQKMIEDLAIKADHAEQKAGQLSGGNQQKVAIGKWLPAQAEIFLFDEPTKGIDVGAKSEIFRLIGKLAQAGKSVLYFSCEFAEIIGIADRILILCDGKIVKELNRNEATQEKILYYASGGRDNDE
jgi:simple sugar transport system ATP-binding protein